MTLAIKPRKSKRSKKTVFGVWDNGKEVSVFETERKAKYWVKNQTPDPAEGRELNEEETRPDWSRECNNCGESPIVPITGLCGPCTFGEAETIGGNW